MNLYLVGYRGSGKTSVAPLVAGRLGWTSLDTDRLIEQATGQRIADIFAREGEKAFRWIEGALVARLAQQQQLVVALGGGALQAEENRHLVGQSGRVVWLRATPQTLARRLAADPDSPSRPSLTGAPMIEEIEQVLADRLAIYQAAADWIVDTDDATPEQIADQIARWFKPPAGDGTVV